MSVVSLPTNVSVEVGNVKVPVFEIDEIIGVVRVLFVNVWLPVVPTTSPLGASWVDIDPKPKLFLALIAVVAPVPPFAIGKVPVTLVVKSTASSAILSPLIALSAIISVLTCISLITPAVLAPNTRLSVVVFCILE